MYNGICILSVQHSSNGPSFYTVYFISLIKKRHITISKTLIVHSVVLSFEFKIGQLFFIGRISKLGHFLQNTSTHTMITLTSAEEAVESLLKTGINFVAIDFDVIIADFVELIDT